VIIVEMIVETTVNLEKIANLEKKTRKKTKRLFLVYKFKNRQNILAIFLFPYKQSSFI
jgi:hypothetical protein